MHAYGRAVTKKIYQSKLIDKAGIYRHMKNSFNNQSVYRRIKIIKCNDLQVTIMATTSQATV